MCDHFDGTNEVTTYATRCQLFRGKGVIFISIEANASKKFSVIHFRASKNKSERINARFNFMSLSYLMIRSVSFNGSWNYPDRHRGSLLSFDLFSPPPTVRRCGAGFRSLESCVTRTQHLRSLTL